MTSLSIGKLPEWTNQQTRTQSRRTTWKRKSRTVKGLLCGKVHIVVIIVGIIITHFFALQVGEMNIIVTRNPFRQKQFFFHVKHLAQPFFLCQNKSVSKIIIISFVIVEIITLKSLFRTGSRKAHWANMSSTLYILEKSLLEFDIIIHEAHKNIC